MTAVLRRSQAARVVVLLVVYGALSLVMNPGGSLGTDTGAKLATLEAMSDGNTFRVDVGYWAEDLDPDGTYHPLFGTERNDEAEWVAVSTLPMLIVARPLYDIGGVLLARIVPMLGAALAALATADLAGRIGGARAARTGFWVAGLASPIAIYALDVWEHAPGAGLMLAGVALLGRTLDRSSPAWLGATAGACFGLAGSMRSEAYIVLLVSLAGACLLALRRGVARSVWVGASTSVAFVALFLLNDRLEAVLGGNSRVARAEVRASSESTTQLGDRAHDALLTWFGGSVGDAAVAVATGLVLASALLGSFWLLSRDRRASKLALGSAAAVMFFMIASGLGFVPGALVASPVAVLALGRKPASLVERYLVSVALGSTLLIWMFSFVGAAAPQWGGRYLLAPTLLLTAVGVAVLEEVPSWFRRTVLGLAAAVTVFGLSWLSYRTHDIDQFFDQLLDRPEQVLIASDGFLLREGGAASVHRTWLSLGRNEPFSGALEIAERSGAEQVGLVSPVAEPPTRGGWTAVSTTELELLDTPYFVHTYERAAEE